MVFQGFFNGFNSKTIAYIAQFVVIQIHIFLIQNGIRIIILDHYLHHEAIGDTDEMINSIQNVKCFQT